MLKRSASVPWPNIAPTWLQPHFQTSRTHNGRHAIFGGARLKLITLAVMCIMLGYMVVTKFEAEGRIETNPAGVVGNDAMLDEAHSQEHGGSNRHEFDAAGVMNGGNKVGMAGAEDGGGIWPINVPGDVGNGDHGAPSNEYDMPNAPMGGAGNGAGVPKSPAHRLPPSSPGSWRSKISSSNPWTHTRPGNTGTKYNNTPLPDDYNNSEELASLASDTDLLSSSPTGAQTSDLLVAPDTPSLGARSRIGKVTILFGTPSQAYERALRTHELHDCLNNYPLHVLRYSLLHDVWTRPAYILSILLRELAKPEGERLEWLLWVDGDTIILNPYVPIEALLPPEDDPEWDDVHLLVSHDWNGLNNGCFPVRVNIWSVELFSAILSFRFYRPEQHLQFWDQSAMDFLVQDEHFAPNVIRTPQRWFNAYQGEHNETLEAFQVRRGDLLVHFPGVGNRDERMRFWLNRAEKHAPDWEVKLKHTSYPEETRDFWVEKKREGESVRREAEDVREEMRAYWEELEDKLKEYGERLSEETVKDIEQGIMNVQMVVESPKTMEKVQKLREAFQYLKNIAEQLHEKVEEANKVLVKEAHEGIFSAEQTTLANAGSPGYQPEIKDVEAKVSTLKDKIVQPTWHRNELKDLIEDLKTAHAKLNGKAEDERKKVEAAKLAEKKKQEDRKKQAEKAKRKKYGFVNLDKGDHEE